MYNVNEVNEYPRLRANIYWFTSCSLADGLTDTVEFACIVAVEEPLPLETRTPFRSIWGIIALHRSGIRIQGFLGFLTGLDCSQDGVRAAPLGVVLQQIPAGCGVHRFPWSRIDNMRSSL